MFVCVCQLKLEKKKIKNTSFMFCINHSGFYLWRALFAFPCVFFSVCGIAVNHECIHFCTESLHSLCWFICTSKIFLLWMFSSMKISEYQKLKRAFLEIMRIQNAHYFFFFGVSIEIFSSLISVVSTLFWAFTLITLNHSWSLISPHVRIVCSVKWHILIHLIVPDSNMSTNSCMSTKKKNVIAWSLCCCCFWF